LRGYSRLTYESPLAKKRSVSVNLSWTEMAFMIAFPFFGTFSSFKWIKIKIHWETSWLNSYITHWTTGNSSLLKKKTCTAVHFTACIQLPLLPSPNFSNFL
jgi:hypothetical protein